MTFYKYHSILLIMKYEILQVLEIAIVYEPDEPDTPEMDAPPPPPPTPLKRNTSTVSSRSVDSACLPSTPRDREATTNPVGSTSSGEGVKDNVPNLRVKGGAHKRSAGFQPDLCCQLVWIDGEAPAMITCLEINSCYGL